MQTCYQKEPRFNGIYSKDNLSRIRDGTYILNLDKYSDIGTHWIALYENKKRKNKYFRIQAYGSIMCGYFCTGFLDFMFARITLTDFANLFLPNNFKRNDDIMLKYFMANVFKNE